VQPVILALDVGTTVAKAVLFDLDGREQAVAEHGYRLLTPRPGWAELDPGAIWDSVLAVLADIAARLNPDFELLSVSLSTQGGTLVPLRNDGQPACNAITWLDQRSAPVVADWQSQGLHCWIRARSGWEPQPGLPLASICALRRDQPQVFAATDRFLSVNDYLAHRLTGEFCTNPSMAAEMLLTNIQTGAWDDELCSFAAIRADQLSPILPAQAVCGQIKTEIGKQVGLPDGIPLINGGQDHSCEALALGLADPGSLLLACGTAWVINAVTDSPDVDSIPPQMALNFHVIPQRWIASQFLGGFGAGMEWWLDQFWPQAETRAERFTSFDSALSQTRPGSDGILYDPVGGTPRSGRTTGGYRGLRLDHSRADMGRAILESAAYEVRHALEGIRAFGLPAEALWMVGGAARNPHWPQIIADVTNLPVSLTQYRHGPALGAMMLAAKSLGCLDDFPRWVVPQVVQPNPDDKPVYDAAYAAYLSNS
jgi:xylulokinase